LTQGQQAAQSGDTRNISRVLVFKLGGAVSLPPVPPLWQHTPPPPPDMADAATLKNGLELFVTFQEAVENDVVKSVHGQEGRFAQIRARRPQCRGRASRTERLSCRWRTRQAQLSSPRVSDSPKLATRRKGFPAVSTATQRTVLGTQRGFRNTSQPVMRLFAKRLDDQDVAARLDDQEVAVLAAYYQQLGGPAPAGGPQ
jgi:hypothetical protein